MKSLQLRLTVGLFFLCSVATAQKKEPFLLLKSGAVKIENGLSPNRLDSFNKHALRLHGKTTAVLQFENLPTEEDRKQLAAQGIELLDYVPQNAYIVSISGTAEPGLLQKVRARALTTLTAKQKMHPALAKGQIPTWAVKVVGTVDVQVAYPKTFSKAEITAALGEKNITVLSDALDAYHILTLRVPAKRLDEVASLPFILYVQPDAPKDQPLNNNSRISSRGTTLNRTVADGGRGLNGEGVVIGIGDDADVQYHVDFTGRLIDRTSTGAAYHGTHTHGTLAGGGIVNEQYRGYAPKATIVSQSFSDILAYAPQYVQDYDMVVTNNSYGVAAGCGYAGVYDVYSYIMDQQAFDYPSLQHVFAAGNSGTDNCSPYPVGFHTVLGRYQTAKNIISVANASYSGTLYGTSSKGPVNDGRIKPEITAMGTNVVSSFPNNSYGNSSGTSMSAPAVAGGLALMYQRYRQLHGNTDPKNGLMKALLCNGATDMGQPGPDYSFGFGFMNLERSVAMMENNQYIIGSLTNGAVKTHSITVPPNTVQVKVMLYWNDPAPAYVTSQNLVNDLDLKVISPSATVTYPKILDPSPSGVTNAAVEGPDHVNNIEQVVIDNPTAGNYTINIQGSVAQNPSQEYYVVYDFVTAGTHLVYPAAGTVLTPGEQTFIAWDAYGNGSNTFDLDYSNDNGTTWNSIATGIGSTARTYNWTAPSPTSDQVLVRIKQNNTSDVQTSAPFTIIGTPTVSLDATQCEGYININWTAVANATDYEVFMLRGSEMIPVATTTSTNYVFSGLTKDSTYWVSVRARYNGKAGRRAWAISRTPNTGTCSGTLSDNDLKLNAIVAPVTGRKYTSTELGNATIVVEIKNLDDAPVSNFNVGYSINNGTWVFENVAATIAAGSVYTHTFSTPENFSGVGTYTISAVVKNSTTDLFAANDTATRVVKQLDNQPISLTAPFLDNMEAATTTTCTTANTGLGNIDRYDFKPGTFGRLRTFINSGVALSGSRSLSIDADRVLSSKPYPVHYLTGTYNLANYNNAVNDLRLVFSSINGSDATSTENRVWIRGNDTLPWIEVYTATTSGTSPSLEIGNLLSAQGQNFSSSFQVKWGVPSSGPIISQSNTKGLLLDNLQLYEVFNDMQLVRIDAPYTYNCGLSNTAPITVTIRNSSTSDLSNVPVRYKINNGAWVSENVASVPAKTTLQYTFTTKAGLSLAGVYTVTAEVTYAGDSYSANNLVAATIYNSALVTSFPYLQNFESSNGGWYATGTNSTWQYGTPASIKITNAASGTKAWKTNLTGFYNDNELSYLYSPCFSIGGMTNPTLSLSVALDLENCGSSLCDGSWIEFSIDNQKWYNLADYSNSGTNWYKAPLYVWSVESYTNWHVATVSLPTGYSSIRFRFVMRSDESVNREGIAIDDIHVYDNTKGIYAGATLSAPITSALSGTNWIDFTSGGKLIASILPNNRDMGNTDVQAYINTGAVRFTGNQYYHNRNITIKPGKRKTINNPLKQNGVLPVRVRLYFLDTETNDLIGAIGCSSCSKPASAYELGIAKFSAVYNSLENGTVSDNGTKGTWSFIAPHDVVKVPFDKGYYAEFQVQNFSEFWLSKGSLNPNTDMLTRVLQFTAKSANQNIVLNWTTADEKNVSRYEIEVAEGTDSLRAMAFETLGTVESLGNQAAQQQYTFTDAEPFKNGVRYYRIKIIDKDGTFQYSEVRSVVLSNVITWQIYPNPSKGIFHLVYQAAEGDKIELQVQDATGRTIKNYNFVSTGFMQKGSIDLTGQASGVYLLQVRHNGAQQSFKLFKE